MRTYPSDSPEAKARIIALALLADGGLDKSELECLDNQDVVSHLGIAAGTFDSVLFEFYQDIEQSGLRRTDGQLDLENPAIEAVLDEIHHPNHRKSLLRAIVDIAQADRDLSLGELRLTSMAMRHWGITHQSLQQTSRPPLSGLPPKVRKLVGDACS
ncbi:MAG: hypothetical protein JNJ44_12470 [Zoogloeaceae bacterium]|nr:hypothetical protein [Zoogloeaceae bacterium]